MLPDLSSVDHGELTLLAWTQREGVTVDHLRQWTNESLDEIIAILADADDADLVFVPVDPNANDTFAASDAEKDIPWNLAHLVVHATASSEEGAAIGSILARGVPFPADLRLRYETAWETVTTRAQVEQRLAESRRIRLGYLDAFPDAPNTELLRALSPRFVERFGEMNSITAFLFALKHELGHHEQFRDTMRQAVAAR